MEIIETGEVLKHPVSPQSENLVAYIRAIGLQQGDRQTLTVHGPDGAVISQYEVPALERDKAQYFLSAGRKRKVAAWVQGTYTAFYRVVRNEADVLRNSFELQLRLP